MRARWIESWDGPLCRGERPDPAPGRGEVLVDVEACGVGLTVLNCIRGDLGSDPRDLPRTPGHELVGRIAAVGEGVNPARVGERVAAYFYLACGSCKRCLAGTESLCEQLAGFVGVHRDGGYAEQTTLPTSNALPLPEAVEPVLATAVPDAIATPVHVARRAGIEPGSRVAVIAAGGGVGIHMVQVARLFGADVVGLEADEAKLEYLERDLDIASIDSTDFDATQLPEAWGKQADVIVDLLGRPPSLQWAQAALASNGRLMLLTTFPGVSFPASPRDLVLGQGAILGSRYASRSEVQLAAELVAEERIRPVVSRVEDSESVDELHAELGQGTLVGRGAIRWA